MAVSFPSDAETFIQTVIPTAIPVSREGIVNEMRQW
jgi:hypothetical protein